VKSVGIALLAIAIGSLWMHSSGHQYFFLKWADAMQPTFGIVLAVIGVAVLGFSALRKRGG
jgi:flagellar motor component MotA